MGFPSFFINTQFCLYLFEGGLFESEIATDNISVAGKNEEGHKTAHVTGADTLNLKIIFREVLMRLPLCSM